MENKKPDINVYIILHSYGKGDNDFEIMDIAFPEMDKLEKELLEKLPSDKSNIDVHDKSNLRIMNQLNSMSALEEMAGEDLGDYGCVSEDIHKELWKKNQMERFYAIRIEVSYETTREYWSGEVDTDVYNFEYELLDLNEALCYFDLLQAGNKIYYIDYEDSGTAYTIEGISEVFDNEYMTTGLYYNIHADSLSAETGHCLILSDEIENEHARFFTSEENAHEAYIAFKNRKMMLLPN